MEYLLVSFLVVALLYGLELIYFKTRFGYFGFLFWLYAFQLGILFGAEFILENDIGQSLPDWIKTVGFVLGFAVFMTIGMMPVIILGLVIVGLILTAIQARK
jgi:hypothetical protein